MNLISFYLLKFDYLAGLHDGIWVHGLFQFPGTMPDLIVSPNECALAQVFCPFWVSVSFFAKPSKPSNVQCLLRAT